MEQSSWEEDLPLRLATLIAPRQLENDTNSSSRAVCIQSCWYGGWPARRGRTRSPLGPRPRPDRRWNQPRRRTRGGLTLAMPNLVVISTSAVPDYVRGSLSRWLTEPAPGLYVGSVSARVREELWNNVTEAVGDGAAVCVYPVDTEQRYTVLTAGEQRRRVLDFDGLALIGFEAASPPSPPNEQLPF